MQLHQAVKFPKLSNDSYAVDFENLIASYNCWVLNIGVNEWILLICQHLFGQGPHVSCISGGHNLIILTDVTSANCGPFHILSDVF